VRLCASLSAGPRICLDPSQEKQESASEARPRRPFTSWPLWCGAARSIVYCDAPSKGLTLACESQDSLRIATPARIFAREDWSGECARGKDAHTRNIPEGRGASAASSCIMVYAARRDAPGSLRGLFYRAPWVYCSFEIARASRERPYLVKY